MKNVFKGFITLAILVATIFTANAQKIGYLQAGFILADMPEVKAADSQLEAFAKQMRNKDSLMVVAFQAKYQEAAKQKQEGTAAPVELEKKGKELEGERAQIEKFEQDMNQQVQDKRKELYQPIIEKVNVAINAIAKEQSFTYIIDASSNVLLYADEKNDIGPLVRAKLGLPAAAAGGA